MTATPVSEQIEALHRLLAELEGGASGRSKERSTQLIREAVQTLHAAEDALVASDRRRDEVLAMLSHELRSPLAAIANATHVLDRISSQTSRTADLRAMILRQTQHLARLVDDLLDVSGLADGDIELHREPTMLRAIVADVVESTRPLIEHRGQRLEVALPDDPVWVEVDPERFEQVLTNLLNNAVKFTEAGGQIGIAIGRDGDTAVARVWDNGAGIAPELLPHVFSQFAPRRRAQPGDGLGIGLTWARRLVERHGGTITAFSEGPGKGSTFEIRLPALPPDAVQRPRILPAPDRPIGQLRVLIVEDDQDTARSLAMLLRLKGCEVRVTNDGPSALEAAEREPPDVVLLDIGLPGMNGYEVAQRLHERPELKKTHLVALTGFGQEEDRRRSREAGFTFHLVKPVDPDILHQLLRNASEHAAQASET